MNLTGTLLLASALCLSVCAAQDTATTSSHTTAKQDMKDAGQATKNAAKDTGSAAKDAGHATKKTSKKVVNKSASKTEEGADKVRQDGSATVKHPVCAKSDAWASHRKASPALYSPAMCGMSA